jgi:hypothetical protein
MKRRITIPQRKRIFLGCEGESEQSYGALLARIVGQQKTDFFHGGKRHHQRFGRR